MKGIATLIRLAKRSLDELRKKQIDFENEKESLIKAKKKLVEELNKEMTLATKNPEMGSFYGKFAKKIQKRESDLSKEIKRIDDELFAISEQITQAFSELKRYEIARDNSLAREKAELQRKETILFDEIAATRYKARDSQVRES